ncbi:YybS family protein [Bacillus sp. J37]|uniref:YybS family protein n=1 Tax=Bacillus sp. J37 TaxID=935837 RepID=UPI0004793C03|nr:YybS family protein [Bacillus sp. J37]
MKKAHVLTEGAVLIALYLVLMLFARYVPVIGTIVLFALPLPFIIFTLRHGIRLTFLLIFAGSILSILFGSIFSVLTAVTFGLSGVIMGYFYKRKQTLGVLVGGSLAYTFSMIVAYIGAKLFMNIDFIQDSISLLEQSIQQSKKILESFTAEEQINAQFAQLEEGLELMVHLVPTIFVTIGMISAVITHLLAMPILKRLRFDLAPLKPFRDWKLPQSIVWYYLIVSILLMVNQDTETFYFTAIINLYFILQFFVIMQGFSFIFYYSYVKGWSKAVPISILIGSFLIPILLYLIRILGIIDLGFPLRGKLSKK